MKEFREAVEKSLLIGLGLVALAREKLDEVAKKGEEYRKELISKGEKQREEIRKVVREELQKAFSELGLATKADIEELSKKLKKAESPK
jgi:polyhydroxyalkanoate synthesis regulator phasin